MLAHRVWRSCAAGRLWSISRNVVWPGPVFHADNKPSTEAVTAAGTYIPVATYNPVDVPFGLTHVANKSGIYAVKNPARLAADAKAAHLHSVIGTVELYGAVVEHEYGYRAEHAVVRSLHMESVCPCRAAFAGELARRLGDRYECEVTLSDSVKAAEAKALEGGPDCVHAVEYATTREDLLRQQLLEEVQRRQAERQQYYAQYYAKGAGKSYMGQIAEQFRQWQKHAEAQWPTPQPPA